MQKKPWLRPLIKWGLLIAALAGIFRFVLGVYPVHTQAMYPSLRDGDLLILLRSSSPDPGDVVCYRGRNGKLRVSRVQAVQGQVVSFEETGWLLDGVIPNDPYRTETKPDPSGSVTNPHRVGGYFVMDDDRTQRGDSRSEGDVEPGQIIGKVIFLLRVRGW